MIDFTRGQIAGALTTEYSVVFFHVPVLMFNESGLAMVLSKRGLAVADVAVGHLGYNVESESAFS